MIATQRAAALQITAPTRLSAYDRLSAFLSAASAVLAGLTVLLLGLWLSAPRSPVTGVPLTPETGVEEGQVSTHDEADEPSEAEFPELRQELPSELVAVTLAVTNVLPDLAKYEQSLGKGSGGGESFFINPTPTPVPPIPAPFKPPWERWRIEYAAKSPAEYMTILAHFNVTLGAVHTTDNQIDYVDDLQAAEPTVTRGERNGEKRLYFMNQRSVLRRWQASKIGAAGVSTDNKILVQFYSEPAVEALTALEAEELARSGHDLSEVQETLFRVRRTDDGYEFYVGRITY